MEREVHYCTTEDGIRIAYCVEGQGPALVVCPYLWESFSVDRVNPWYENFIHALGRGRTMVRYDPRGVGLSPQEVEDLSVEGLLKDLEAVVEAVAMPRVSLLAMGASTPKAILYAARHAQRLQSLVLLNGWARVLDIQPEESLRALADLARANWSAAAQAMVGRISTLEAEEALAEVYRRSTTGDAVARLIVANLHTDVSSVLSNVTVPTLIAHLAQHNVLPFALAQQLAASIPGALLVPLQLSDQLDWRMVAVRPIDSFLRKHAGEPLPARAKEQGPFRSVLFTDIVGHTEMMQRLGDERGREVLREHERITREVLKAHGGTEVKTMGDGFMASFASVTKAVECAIALQRAFDERNRSLPAHPEPVEGRAEASAPLQVRCGLNAGEPIEEEGDLFGATVILASRIAAKAEGGEILASDVVRGLCSGKGFLFADRGEFVAKGFEEPVRVYEVRWREPS